MLRFRINPANRFTLKFRKMETNHDPNELKSNDVLSDLKSYFANTPADKFVKDWEESEKCGLDGSGINEFMNVQNTYKAALELECTFETVTPDTE